METSDSEYFESADEDFASDYEDNKLQSQTHHPSIPTSTHKLIEPELCKLKIDKKSDNGPELEEKTVQKETKISSEDATKTGNITNNIKHLASIIPSIIPEQKSALSSSSCKAETKANISCQLRDGHGDNNEAQSQKSFNTLENWPSISNLEESENDVKVVPEKIIQPNKVHEDTILLKTSTEGDSSQEEIQGHKAKDNVLLKTGSSQLSTKIEAGEPCPEGNLWDDGKLDWKTANQKEDTENNAESSNIQEGWDDFDAEWETHTTQHTQSEQDSASICTKSSPIPDDQKSVAKPAVSDENLWNDDEDWESIDQPLEKPKKDQEESGWGGWGVFSILNTATSLTSQVSQGFSTVLENGMGIPQPEELAKINQDECQKDGDIEDNNFAAAFGLGNLVSGVSQLTKFMESTGTKVITGGLDTLEAIGKKTVEVLQEGDPGFKRKRAFLKLDSGKPNLSQILREAKEKAKEENKESKELSIKRDGYYKSNNYETLFDDYQGIVHLEALEMLSRLCHIKLDNIMSSLTGSGLKDLQETLEQVKELSELPEDEENEVQDLADAQQSISDVIKDIDIPISFQKFFDVANCNESEFNLDGSVEHKVIHQKAIELLAQLTALAVEQFHKAGELLLVKEHRSTVDEAEGLVQLTTLIKACITKTAKQYADQFSTMDNVIGKVQVNEYITNIFYEAANSARYVQNAFQLLIPVLQVGAV